MTMSELARKIEEQGQKVDEALGIGKEDDMGKIGPKEAALQKARADDLTIPAALDRTKGLSKDDFDKLHDKLGVRKTFVSKKTGKTYFSPTKPAKLTEADKKAIAELKKAEKLASDEKKKAGLAKLAAAKAEKKAVKDAAKANGPAKPQRTPPVAAKPKAATKAAKTAKPTSEVRKGSKTELIGNLLRRPEGCTTADVLKACGWPAVSMPQQAKAVGVKLRKEKDGKVTRYWAA